MTFQVDPFIGFSNSLKVIDHHLLLEEIRSCTPCFSAWLEFISDHIIPSYCCVQQGDQLGTLRFTIGLSIPSWSAYSIKYPIGECVAMVYLDDGTLRGSPPDLLKAHPPPTPYLLKSLLIMRGLSSFWSSHFSHSSAVPHF